MPFPKDGTLRNLFPRVLPFLTCLLLALLPGASTPVLAQTITELNLQSSTAACTPDAHTLCLNQGRFAVTADFQASPGGPTVSATARPLTSDSGFFWFFDPNNVEIVVKVLNACGITSHAYWVFAAGLTNVQVDLSVTDTLRAETRHYTNPQSTPFLPIQDTGAFSTCP